MRIVALMLLATVLAALAIGAAFGALGLVPATRPPAADVFGSIGVDYKLALNAVATAAFAGLWALTARRGATDPVCGWRSIAPPRGRCPTARARCTSAPSTAATPTRRGRATTAARTPRRLLADGRC